LGCVDMNRNRSLHISRLPSSIRCVTTAENLAAGRAQWHQTFLGRVPVARQRFLARGTWQLACCVACNGAISRLESATFPEAGGFTVTDGRPPGAPRACALATGPFHVPVHPPQRRLVSPGLLSTFESQCQKRATPAPKSSRQSAFRDEGPAFLPRAALPHNEMLSLEICEGHRA
jgi:hypothetical protein